MLSYQLRLEQNVLVTSESEAPRPIAPILKSATATSRATGWEAWIR